MRKSERRPKCRGTFCTSSHSSPNSSQRPAVHLQTGAIARSSSRRCDLRFASRGWKLAIIRSIKRPIARIPVPCISLLREAGAPQATGKVSRTADQ